MRPRRETPGNSGARGDLAACRPVPSGLAVSAQVSLGRAMVDFRVSDTERKFDEGRTSADEGAFAAAREELMRRRAGLSYTRSDIGKSVPAAWARQNFAVLVDGVRRGRPAEVWNHRRPWCIIMSPERYDELLKIVQKYQLTQDDKKVNL